MLNVESEPGKGSRFEILLPCIDRPAVNPGKISDPEPAHQAGTGTVLVIEDEEVLRLAVAKLLRNGGFSVIEAGDGATGASLFAGNQDKIDVVLLDVTLPGMSGREVLEELRRLKPDVKIVLTSAFGEKDSLRFVGGSRPWTYIRKPYRLNELKTVIRSACGAKTPGTGRASEN
jgi:CheY-like chemotaxis protein